MSSSFRPEDPSHLSFLSCSPSALCKLGPRPHGFGPGVAWEGQPPGSRAESTLVASLLLRSPTKGLLLTPGPGQCVASALSSHTLSPQSLGPLHSLLRGPQPPKRDSFSFSHIPEDGAAADPRAAGKGRAGFSRIPWSYVHPCHPRRMPCAPSRARGPPEGGTPGPGKLSPETA